jgi:hypothetical protein
MSDTDLLDELQRNTFRYFLDQADPGTGLVRDRTEEGAPASIAATGLALACYPVAVERGFLTRKEAIGRTITTLRFFSESRQGPEPDATGHRGFYYHFLDMETGRRALRCELSTLDTALLAAGFLTVATYFDAGSDDEADIRSLAGELVARVDWRWALNGGKTITHGWRPGRGFLPYRYEGYHEGIIMYLLALASPRHPVPVDSYTLSTTRYKWKKIYGREYVYAGPLFIHQLSHIWIDFRGIPDEYMRSRGIDYFENSRRATYVQQEYAIRNPKGFAGYGSRSFGLSAGNGPGPATQELDGRIRRFLGYRARGVPFGPDDGTLAPWATVASLPFAPEIVLPAIRHFESLRLGLHRPYGFRPAFNPSFRLNGDGGGSGKQGGDRGGEAGWVSPFHFGLDEGPIMMMIENYRSEFVWKLMKRCPMLVDGLRRAGFAGGWLEGVET